MREEGSGFVKWGGMEVFELKEGGGFGIVRFNGSIFGT